MPTPFEVYSNIIYSMTTEAGYTYKVNGLPHTVQKLTIEEATEEFFRYLDSVTPAEDDLPAKLESFRKIKMSEGVVSPGNLVTRFTEHPEEMNERLRYSKQLRTAMKPYIRRAPERRKIWYETEKEVFGKNRDGSARRTSNNGRHGHQLMETEDTPENRRHNEKVVAANALANREITPAQYEKIRYDAWIKYGYSKEKARQTAHEEMLYGAEFIFDCFKEKVDAVINNLDRYQAAAGKILGGKATPQEMKQALETLQGDGMYFMFTAKFIVPEIAATLGEERKKELTAYSGKIEKIGTTLYPLFEMIQTYTMPQYAYLDADELFKAGITQVSGEKVDPNIEIYTVQLNTSITNLLMGRCTEIAEKYGFTAADQQNYPLMDKYAVFSKNGATIVLDIESLSLETCCTAGIHDNTPGRYVDKNLKREALDLLTKHNFSKLMGGLPGNNGEPREYEAVWDKLGEIKDKKLGDAARAEDCEALRKEFDALLVLVKAYLDSVGEPAEADKLRIDLAKEVKEFAETKLEQIKVAELHKETVRRGLAARAEAEKLGYSDMQIITADMFACRNGSDVTLLCRSEKDGQLAYVTDRPGQCIDGDYQQAHDKLMTGYNNVINKILKDGGNVPMDLLGFGAALLSAKYVRVGDDAKTDKCHDMDRALANIKKAADAYLEAAWKNPQVSIREAVDVARDALRFVQIRQERLSLVEEHTNTELQKTAKLNKFASEVETMSKAFSEGKINARDIPFNVSKKEAAESALDSYIIQREGIEKFKDNTFSVDDPDNLDALITVHEEEAFDKNNKEILAGYILLELMANEEKLFPAENAKKPIRDMAAAGHTDELIDMVQNSQSFIENIRALDLSERGAYTVPKNNGVCKTVANDIMKAYLEYAKKAGNNRPEAANRHSLPNPNVNRLSNANPDVNRNSNPVAPNNGGNGMVMGGGH